MSVSRYCVAMRWIQRLIHRQIPAAAAAYRLKLGHVPAEVFGNRHHLVHDAIELLFTNTHTGTHANERVVKYSQSLIPRYYWLNTSRTRLVQLLVQV